MPSAMIRHRLGEGTDDLLDRRRVVGGLVDARRELEEPAGWVLRKMPPEEVLLLVCRQLEMSALETIEILGAAVADQILWRRLLPLEDDDATAARLEESDEIAVEIREPVDVRD